MQRGYLSALGRKWYTQRFGSPFFTRRGGGAKRCSAPWSIRREGALFEALRPRFDSGVVGFPIESGYWISERSVGVKQTGKGRRKVGSKKRRMRAKIRHRKR